MQFICIVFERVLKTFFLTQLVHAALSRDQDLLGIAHNMKAPRLLARDNTQCSESCWWLARRKKLPVRTPVKLKPTPFYVSVLSISHYIFSPLLCPLLKGALGWRVETEHITLFP